MNAKIQNAIQWLIPEYRPLTKLDEERRQQAEAKRRKRAERNLKVVKAER